MTKISKEYGYSIISFIVLIVMVYFPVVHEFSSSPIHMWDEATYANNSIDMALGNGNILVIQHLNEPDLYNTKPPFVIWLQALCIKSFGINEFAIRLPSAIFSFLTVIMVYFFCVRNLKSEIIGLIASAILVSSKGFISKHVVRSGDLDSILVFWLVLGLFTFLDYIIRKPDKSIFHFSLLSISLILGFLSKGIAGFFFVPFMFIVACLPFNFWVYTELRLYYSAIITLLSCFLYYVVRESLSSGYLDVVFGSEILRFNSVVMSWHVQPYDFYYDIMKTKHFDAFFHFLPITLITPFVTKSNKFRISIYLLIVSVGYFLLISYPDVKLSWYDAPLYPILSILLSLGLVECLCFLKNKFFISVNQHFINIGLIVFTAFIIYSPYKAILMNNKYNNSQIYSREFDGAYLRHLKESNLDIKNLIVLKKEKHIEHYDQVLFYIRAYNIEDNMQIKLKHEIGFNNGELVMTSQKEFKNEILEEYFVDIINSWKEGVVYHIKAAKNNVNTK